MVVVALGQHNMPVEVTPGSQGSILPCSGMGRRRKGGEGGGHTSLQRWGLCEDTGRITPVRNCVQTWGR